MFFVWRFLSNNPPTPRSPQWKFQKFPFPPSFSSPLDFEKFQFPLDFVEFKNPVTPPSQRGGSHYKISTWCYIWADKTDLYTSIKKKVYQEKTKSYHCYHKVPVFLLYLLYAVWNCFYSLRKMDTWLNLLFANVPSLNQNFVVRKKALYFYFEVSRIPAKINLFKFNNGNTSRRCEICWKLTINTPERRHLQCYEEFQEVS